MLNISKERVKAQMTPFPLHSLRTLRTPRSGRVVAYWLVGIFLLLLFCLFLPWQQNIAGYGKITALTPQDRPQTVETAIAGRISNWYVREGEYVSTGDTILTLAEIKTEYFDPELLERTREQLAAQRDYNQATEQKVAALATQVAALEEGLDLSLAKARNKVEQGILKVASDSADLEAARINFQVAQRQFAGYEGLYEDGLVSLTDYENRKQKLQETNAKITAATNKYLASQNELINARIELSSLRAEYADKIAKAQSDRNTAISSLADGIGKLASMQNKYVNLDIRNDQYVIIAPQDGYVVRALRTGIGETIKEGEPVVTVMPDAPAIAVEVYVNPMDIPLLSVGTPVRIEFDGWPALQFSGWPNVSVGTFGGRVSVIDYVNSSNGKYRMLVTPDATQEPWPDQLRLGSGAYGWAMLTEVPVWYELWRQLNGFPPDLIDSVRELDTPKEKKTDTGPDGALTKK